jgi:hypothetical protein
MAERLNDTDPQSPRAFSRTDPGLGEPVMPASQRAERMTPPAPQVAARPASIEDILDGITGPRPPSSRPSRARMAGVPVRTGLAVPPPAQASAPKRSAEAPDPALYSAAGEAPAVAEPAARELEPLPRVEPESAPPVARRAIEERTVHTRQRAIARNLAVLAVSSAAVAVMMLTILRWREAHRPHHASEVVVLPAAPAETVEPAGAPVEALPEPSPDEVKMIELDDPGAVGTPGSGRATRPGMRRARSTDKGGSLDDLNQQISH